MKIKRWIAITAIAVVAAFGVFIVLLSPIAEWYIEKHAEAWTGRVITMDKLRINLFRASVTVDGLKVLERDKQKIFFSAAEVYVNAEWWPLLRGNTELIAVSLKAPSLTITQRGNNFNYDDLVTRFTPAPSTPPTRKEAAGEPVRYWIRNIALHNGELRYQNRGLGNEVKVVKLNATCPLIAWDKPQHRYDAQFTFADGGNVKTRFDLDIEKLNYALRYDMEAFSVAALFPYLRDYLNVKSMDGHIDANLRLYGNFNEPEAIASHGTLALNNFSITDPNNEPLVSLGSLDIAVDTLNVKSNVYAFGHIGLDKPFFKLELFDNGNNFSRLLNYTSPASPTPDNNADSVAATRDSTVAVEQGNVFQLMANYVSDLSEQYQVSNYKADSVTVSHGTLIFNDYTLHSRFNYYLESFYAKAEAVNSHNENIEASIASILNKSGKMTGEVKVNPNGFRDMEITYAVSDLKITDFNPYSDYYVAHPFVNGTCYYKNRSTISNGFLVSDNHLEIRKIVVGKKVKNNTAVNLPIRFAVALLRDKNGDILLDLPVKGDLNDPKYRLWPVIWQVFKNLIAKAAAAPGKLLAKRTGVDEKYLEGFAWQTLQDELDAEQMKALDAAAQALEQSPEMNVEFIKAYNLARERDELAVNESKKRFLFFSRRISSPDVVTPEEEKVVESVQVRDSVFNAYVDEQLHTEQSLMSIFDKSKRLVGSDKLKEKFNSLLTARTEAINKYLIAKGVDEKRFRIVDPATRTELPYEATSRTVINFYLADERSTDDAPATAGAKR